MNAWDAEVTPSAAVAVTVKRGGADAERRARQDARRRQRHAGRQRARAEGVRHGTSRDELTRQGGADAGDERGPDVGVPRRGVRRESGRVERLHQLRSAVGQRVVQPQRRCLERVRRREEELRRSRAGVRRLDRQRSAPQRPSRAQVRRDGHSAREVRAAVPAPAQRMFQQRCRVGRRRVVGSAGEDDASSVGGRIVRLRAAELDDDVGHRQRLCRAGAQRAAQDRVPRDVDGRGQRDCVDGRVQRVDGERVGRNGGAGDEWRAGRRVAAGRQHLGDGPYWRGREEDGRGPGHAPYSDSSDSSESASSSRMTGARPSSRAARTLYGLKSAGVTSQNAPSMRSMTIPSPSVFAPA